MICSKCSANVSESDRFCSHCGHPLKLVVTNSVDARNGKIEAPIFQAGRDIFYSPGQPESLKAPKASYDAVPKWRSPFTQAVLSWIGVVLGVLGIVPISKILGFHAAPSVGIDLILWLVALLIAFVALGLVWSLRELTKRETRRPLRFGWAISGYNHRITLEKIEVSRCPTCNGKMKYYMKPTDWYYRINNNGSRKRVVTERTPMLECLRNPKHSFEVDPAADNVS